MIKPTQPAWRLCAIALIIMTLTTGRACAADTQLAPVPKMTDAEAAETVLPDGVIVRITDTTDGDVRVGDGITAGGQPIAAVSGWQEGDPLTADLNTDGHAINLGYEYTLITLGGWAAISGGQLAAESGTMQLSSSGSVLMTLTGAQSLVSISRFEWVDPYFELDVPLGTVVPNIQFAASLTSTDWQPVTPDNVTTGTVYTLYINAAQFADLGFFRAALSDSEGSIVNINGALRENDQPVALASDLDPLTADIAANAAATASNTSDIAALASSVTTQALIFHGSINGTNRTATLAWDFTNNVFTVEVTDD